MPKHGSTDPNQLPLFEQAADAAHSPLELTPNNQNLPDPVGPVVWLGDRANTLLHVLHDIGQARMRSGFRQASSLESPHATDIQYRYGKRLPAVQAGANSKETRLRWQAGNAFYTAAGGDVLRASGMASPEGLDIAISKMFTQFEERYFSGTNAERNRSKFRRTLNRQLELLSREDTSRKQRTA